MKDRRSAPGGLPMIAEAKVHQQARRWKNYFIVDIEYWGQDNDLYPSLFQLRLPAKRSSIIFIISSVLSITNCASSSEFLAASSSKISQGRV